MKKLFTFYPKAFVLAALSALTSVFAPVQALASGDTIEIGYVSKSENMWKDYGLSFGSPDRIGIAVVFPKEMVGIYAGNKVTELNFGWSTTKFSPTADVFIRTGLDSENVMETQAELVNYKDDNFMFLGTWNAVELPESYVIPADEDMVVGYFVDIPQKGVGQVCIPYCSLSLYYEDTQYIMNASIPTDEGGNTWINLYDDAQGHATSPLFVSMTIEDSTGNTINLCNLIDARCKPINYLDELTGGVMKVANCGTNDIESLTLKYQFGEVGREETIQLNHAIASGDKSLVVLPFATLGSGKHTVEISEVNGATNGIKNEIEYSVIGVPADVADKYETRPIMEYFCSENDYSSPRYYDEIILPGLEEYDYVIPVNQHMDDQFMQFDPESGSDYDDATTMLIDFANGNLYQVYMPVMAVNRTSYPNTSLFESCNNPASNVIFPRFVGELLYEPAVETPAFASVNIDNMYDESKRKLDFTVSGYIEPNILPEGENLFLTVYVMEDKVLSDSQEMPAEQDFLIKYPDGIYPQRNVIRLCMTPMYGTEISDGGDYSRTFDIEIEEDWRVENMSVVAFLNRGRANDSLSRNIINANEQPIMSASVIAPIVDEASETHVFNLAGQQVDKGNVTSGVYIIKNGNKTSKVMIR